MRVSHDERRHAACDVFGDTGFPIAEVNVVTLYPGSVCAWHRHDKQWDYAYVASGTVRFAEWWDGEDQIYFTCRQGEDWYCMPGVWHGYECIGNEPAIIVYGISQPYDPADEFRRPVMHGDFPHTPR